MSYKLSSLIIQRHYVLCSLFAYIVNDGMKGQEDTSYSPAKAKDGKYHDNDKYIGNGTGQLFLWAYRTWPGGLSRQKAPDKINYERQEESPETTDATRRKLSSILPTPDGKVRPYDPKNGMRSVAQHHLRDYGYG